MKQQLLLILLLVTCISFASAQSDTGAAVQQNQAVPFSPPPPPPKPAKIYPVDTQAVLEMLKFDKLGYDSLFSIESGPVMIQKPEVHHVTVRDFILPILLLVMLAYVTWLRYVFAKELGENLTVILNSNLGQQIYRDREFSANIFKLLTFVNFAFCAGVFVYLLTQYFELEMPFKLAIYNIGLCIGGLSVLYLLKGLLYRIIGSAFKLSAPLQFFRFNALVIYHLLGIGLLPFVILAAFAEPPVNNWAIFGALILIAIALLIRLVKGFASLRLSGRFHFVYFLLYICALEIAPLLIAIKVFTDWA